MVELQSRITGGETSNGRHRKMRDTGVRDKAANAGPRSLKRMLGIFDAIAHSPPVQDGDDVRTQEERREERRQEGENHPEGRVVEQAQGRGVLAERHEQVTARTELHGAAVVVGGGWIKRRQVGDAVLVRQTCNPRL